MYVLCLVAQSCLTLGDPVDYSPPGSSLHGILQARILEWVAMPSSRGSSRPRDQTQVSHIAGGIFTIWPPEKPRWISPAPGKDNSLLFCVFILLKGEDSMLRASCPLTPPAALSGSHPLPSLPRPGCVSAFSEKPRVCFLWEAHKISVHSLSQGSTGHTALAIVLLFEKCHLDILKVLTGEKNDLREDFYTIFWTCDIFIYE